MMTEALFNYVRINLALCEALATHLVGKASFALLGPRAGGKRYLLEKVMEELTKRGCPHLYIALDSAGFLCTEKDVMENLWKHMISWEGLVKPDQPWQSIQDFFDWLDAEQQRLDRHICLLLGNFGRIAEPLASRFLTLVRGAHDSGWLALGLCGEANVTGLVHGAGSSYQCDHFYVLQGLEKEVFIEFYERMLARLHLNIADKDQFVDVLYQKTAGDMRLLRHTLHAFSMQRRTEPILDTDLPESFLDFEEPRIWSFEAFGPLQKLAKALKTEDLMLIRSLMGSAGACMLPPAFSGAKAQPHALELMGLVNRQSDGVTLKFSSPYMEKFARDYFNSVRLGDLFARAQDWKSAFACYAEVTQLDLLLRPYSPADFSTVRHLVEGLCGEMHRRVAQASTPGEALVQIQNLAVQGCRLLLGHAAVSFWERHSSGWRYLKTGVSSVWEVEDQRAKNILEIKGAGIGPMGGTVQFLSQDRAHFAVVETPEGRRFAIVVADWDRLHLPTLQQSLTEQLLEDFSIAWRHAANVAFTENRLKEHLQITDTTNEVFAALGKEITDVPGALESIGRKLLQVRPFTRVAWLLKKPGEDTLRLVNEETSSGMSPVFPEALEVPIDAAGGQLEANCFAEALRADAPFVISAPQSRSLLPAEFRHHLKGLCYVLGLRDETGETVGAFFLEQQEGILRSHDLKHDLSSLARRVAIVIGQAERTEALQKALDGIGDPIIVVDTDDSLRFANAPASRLLQLDDAQASRWLPKKRAMDWKSSAPAAPFNAPALKEAPKDRENNVSFIHNTPAGNEIMWNATLFPLKDWLGLNYCHVERLRDRTTITKALDALYVMGTAANASECLNSFFLAARKVTGKNAKMVRLYIVDPAAPQTLKSHRAIGFKSEKKSLSFESGKVRLSKKDCPNAWKTFDGVPTSRPVCWKWDPEGEEGVVMRTPKGLEYEVTRIGVHADELEKKTGSFWVDLPLVVMEDAGARVLGKITLALESEEELPTPEAYEYLARFARVAAGLLGGVQLNEGRMKELEEMEKRALATSSHNMATKTAALAGFLSMYRDLADDINLLVSRSHQSGGTQVLADLKKIYHHFDSANQQLGRSLHSLNAILTRTKERLRGVQAVLQSMDVAEVIKEASLVVQGRAEVDISGHGRIMGDSELLLMVFQELFEDSVAYYHRTDGRANITVEVETMDKGRKIKVTYEDNGPGIPAKHSERIFEPYFKYGKKKGGPGSGVGLYFVKNVIDAHGGTIEQKAEPNAGINFVIKFPADVNTSPD